MIFEPIELGDFLLPNRIVSAPLASFSSKEDGSPSRKSLEIYGRFARSGVGAAIVEHHAVSVCGRTRPVQFLTGSDETAIKHSEISRMFKESDIICLAQINHAGANIADIEVFDMEGYRCLSPSGIPVGEKWTELERRPEVLTRSEIKKITEDFVKAAIRMVDKGGYDGIQIHASHGYLIGQFLSPLTNVRNDEYGGSRSGRARLLFEIADGIRSSLKNIPLAVRLGAADSFPEGKKEGLSVLDTACIAKELALLGVDMISISGNLCGYGLGRVDSAYFAPYSRVIKEAVEDFALVECTGGIGDPRTAERLLKDRVCDLVGIGRLMLSDPGFLADWKEMS